MSKINEKEIKQIFLEIKANKQEGYEKLYSKYNKLVYSIAFSILKNQTDSEDIVQIVFSKIYELPINMLPTKNEASWIYSLTKNTSISFLRKKRNYLNIEDIYELENKNSEIEEIIEKDLYKRLLKKLNNNEKEIISLKIIARIIL